MNRLLLSFVSALLVCGSVNAATVFSGAGALYYVSDGSTLRAFESSSLREVWRTKETAEQLVVDRTTGDVAAFDANHASIYDARGHALGRIPLSEAPLAAVLDHSSFLFTSRTRGTLQRATTSGSTSLADVGSEASLLRKRGDTIVAYSRIDGVATVLDGATTRAIKLAPYASDLEIDGRFGYLTYPRRGKLAVFRLDGTTKPVELESGAVPVDAALRGEANALSAGEVLVADPSSKRVWRTERQQSTTQAVGRGFLRGLLGLGLYNGNSSSFPTGIDRIVTAGKLIYAYDTSSSTLYEVNRKSARKISTDVPLDELAFDDVGHVVSWDSRLQRLVRLP